MNVEEFVTTYNKIVKNDGDTVDYLTDRYQTDYIPFRNKVTTCENIVKVTSHKEIESVDDKKSKREIFASNRPTRYMLFMLSLIDEYTDIDINFGDGEALINEYEMMDEADLIQTLIVGDINGFGGIPKNEYERYKMIMDMVVADVTENENNLVTCINHKAEAISSVFQILLNTFGEVLGNTLTNEFSNMSDEDKESLFSVIQENIK